MLERRIEEASLNSWPALQQMLFDGWIIRFAGGYTKRANSVTPMYPSEISLQEKIAFCEKLYQDQHLPTIFRLPSFSADTLALNDLLAQRDYRFADKTLVLSTTPLPRQRSLDSSFQAVSLEEWLPFYSEINQADMKAQASHHAILRQIVANTLFAVYYDHATPVACGLGILEHDVFGIFDITTHPAHRKRGYGTQLVRNMLDWAAEKGANRAYLQVVNTNRSALHLYTKFGFQEIYHYWYRIQS